MSKPRLLVLALAAGLAIAGPVASQTYHMTAEIEITVIPEAGCVPAVTLPPAFAGPAANHGQIVGQITFTSDIPCAAPPAIALSPGSVFALAGNTLPTNLVIGPTDVAGGIYPVTATVTVGAGGQRLDIKNLLQPGPASAVRKRAR